jgi:hypothetical protein
MKRNTVASLIFWSFFIAFIIHVIDESLLFNGFVNFIHKHYWSRFLVSDFYFANSIWIIAIGISAILYDIIGEKVMILPLFFVWERVLNGLFHVVSCISFNDYNPGMASSLIFFLFFSIS